MRNLLTAIIVMATLPNVVSAQCGTNPTSGVTTISLANQIVNSYYPGTGNPTAGQFSVGVGTIDSRGSSTALSAGDLVLVVQMQGADIDSSNSNAYGNGVAGGSASGALTSNLYAGYYEYNTVISVVGSTINFTYSLANNYYSQAFSGSTAIRTYQVIRVPRYYDLTINAGASVICPSWNGTTGGVTILDAANVLTLNGTIDVSALGFRGGGGKNFNGAGAGNSSGLATLANTDYKWNSPVTNAANTTGGVKGEGIAGTPAYTLANGLTATATGSVEGYPGGSMGRSAPGNAGGGSTDGIPVGGSNNQYNTGGGGGANAGDGGNGGSGWHSGSGTVATYPYGGYGGTAYTAASLQRLVMGGAGGAGTANNSTTANEYQSSGGCGGGIIIARAKSYAGNGSVLANGGDAPGIIGVGGVANTDAAGGAGAGGTIVVVTRAAGATGLGSVTASAKGGKGGDMTNYYDHGPGGGGGGGFIYTNGTMAAATVTGGLNGKTRVGSISGPITNDFGATAGSNGQLVTLGFVPVLINNNNIASPCGTLPVSLTSINAVVGGAGTLVQWSVNSAANLHHFEVEYSLDGNRFAYAGTKNFLTGIKTYEFFHNYTAGSIVYYRLKMVADNNGFSYSKTITVRFNRNGNTALIFPNPASGAVTVLAKWSGRTDGLIRILDASGRTLLQKDIGLQTGDNSFSLDTDNFSAGVYVVQVLAGKEIIATERLQVLKK